MVDAFATGVDLLFSPARDSKSSKSVCAVVFLCWYTASHDTF